MMKFMSVLIAGGLLMPAPAAQMGTANRFTPDCFFALHLEPTTANDTLFAAVVRLVELAERYKVKVTFEFTPQWAEMILADEKKLALLRKWQKNGHEVGAQHHPMFHPGGWDGYTDVDPKELKDTRIDAVGRSRPREKYLGTMSDFMRLLNRLAAPERVVTGAFGRPPTWSQVPARLEFPRGVFYETEGIHEPPRPPRLIGRQHWELPMFFVGNDAMVLELSQMYEETKEMEGDIVGFITHEFNFQGAPDVIERWFKFLQSKDPEGKHNKTVSQIMKERLAE
ncbi:MAG: hypothetical protein HY238_01530 [Acidobacteria bacterium]|nr:hypothetical protein [Acidobacteriota bacterium]